MKTQKKNNQEGVFLIELIIFITIAGVLLMTFSTLFNTTINISRVSDFEDEVFFSGEYFLSYIENDINKADEIYLFDEGNYDIIFYQKLAGDKKENYYSYIYKEKEGEVARVAKSLRSKATDKELKTIALKGYNNLCNYVVEYKFNFVDDKSNYIDLVVVLDYKDKKRSYNKKIYLDCEIIDLRSKIYE